MWVVEIDTTTGDFTYLVESFSYLGGSLAFDGISGFDQKRGNIYYSVDFESSFVFSANVNTGALRAPTSIDSSWVQNYVYDDQNNNMYVLAGYLNEQNEEYVYLISLSLDNGADGLLLNMTEAGIGALGTSTMDYTTGTYYLLANQLFASFNVANPTQVSTSSVVCPNNLFPVYIAYDYKTGSLIGIGEGDKPKLHYAFLQISISGNSVTCTATKIPFKSEGIATCYSYDPVAQLMYLGWASGEDQLAIYDPTANTVTTVVTPWILSDVQVSYVPPAPKN
eukprot:TRINITY_DN224_c0_g1_i6.p1 TRINITY_DN224_c0_g1~~TRINITY_DN224_c0_g1_i6.p1  ORF type:complete len:317 (-),score=73.92 TRINITY_DN224_c0_g1_i6:99-938(-)